MKKIFIIAILGTTLVFQNCAPKEKQEVTVTANDSIVTETVIIDSITTTNGTEVIVEEVATETEKISAEKPTAVTKVTVKEPAKAVAPVKTATKVTTSTSGWVVPAKYQTMKNPTSPKVDLAIGKSLYTKHCKSCHGSEGFGDGVKAKDMKDDLGDFSTKKFQAQTDGALFYKTSFGRDDMPAFNKKLPSDEDRWLIVNYLRTL